MTISSGRGGAAACPAPAPHALRCALANSLMPEFTVRRLLGSRWFAELVEGRSSAPDERTAAALSMLAEMDGAGEARVLGRPATVVAGCLLHVLGVEVRGSPFPIATDPVATLRLLASIPEATSGRRLLAAQVVEACEAYQKAIQLPIRW